MAEISLALGGRRAFKSSRRISTTEAARACSRCSSFANAFAIAERRSDPSGGRVRPIEKLFGCLSSACSNTSASNSRPSIRCLARRPSPVANAACQASADRSISGIAAYCGRLSPRKGVSDLAAAPLALSFGPIIHAPQYRARRTRRLLRLLLGSPFRSPSRRYSHGAARCAVRPRGSTP